jgi:hypothetical protein
MGTSISLSGKNINNSAPIWFIKTKNAVSMLANTAVIILLAVGLAKDNSLLILMLRVGLSGFFDAINMILGSSEPPSAVTIDNTTSPTNK